jgi:hypothetical protein
MQRNQSTQRSHSRIVSADESSSALFAEPFAPASHLVRGVFLRVSVLHQTDGRFF